MNYNQQNAQESSKNIPGLTIRFTQPQDADYLKKWLMSPDAVFGFPMCNEIEVDDAVRKWISFARVKSSLTAELNGVVCGIVTLYIQPYRKLLHHSEFGIIVAPEYRSKGVGAFLMNSVMRLAKEQFHIELISLQVFAENRAIQFYKRFGFREIGRQSHWLKEIKEDNGKKEIRYIGRILMERFL